jgi:hypothetical protein
MVLGILPVTFLSVYCQNILTLAHYNLERSFQSPCNECPGGKRRRKQQIRNFIGDIREKGHGKMRWGRGCQLRFGGKELSWNYWEGLRSILNVD